MTDAAPIASSVDNSDSSCNASSASRTQNLLPTVGRLVRVRGFLGRIRRSETFVGCQRVEIASLGMSAPPRWHALLTPFDRVEPAAAGWKWRGTRLSDAARELALRSIDTTLPGRAALQPALALVPWQTAAGAALREGRSSRLLLADDVGLGKTVQAGLALAALDAVGEARRSLVLTPSGLRDQWAAELARLFGRECTVADPARLRRARRELPPHLNPWAAWPTVVTSLDFVKQPEVLAAVSEVPWDVVVIDEAHRVGARTDRLDAVHALARRAPYVLLLTATPHGGREDAFAALCGIGRVPGDGAGLAAVRRARADVGLPADRRLRMMAVRLTPAERRLHHLLQQYAGSVWMARSGSSATELAMTVLLKRAASSAHALQRSLAWRIRLLEGIDAPEMQPVLPFDEPGEREPDDEGFCAALGAPGLADRARELRLLRALERLASAAAQSESKIDRVRRLILRAREPVLVFTEYRDTLERARQALEPVGPLAILHGGLARPERRAALDAFTSGRARVLLATDVAGEGLNLHATCRLVVSIELPWTPSRLEQRVGRVDRIGQQRRVHGVHLIARDTAESRVLARLAARVRNIRHALGVTGAGGVLPEPALAAAALGLEGPASPARTGTMAVEWLGSESVPAGECQVAEAARRLYRAATSQERRPSRSTRWCRRPAHGVALVRVSRRMRLRLGLPPGVTIVFEVEARSRAGSVAGRVLVPVLVELAPGVHARGTACDVATALVPLARAKAVAHASLRLADLTARHRGWAARAHARESALLEALRAAAAHTPIQAGLFDTRAVQAAARREVDWHRRQEHHALRLQRLADEQTIDASPEPRVVLALVLR